MRSSFQSKYVILSLVVRYAYTDKKKKEALESTTYDVSARKFKLVTGLGYLASAGKSGLNPETLQEVSLAFSFYFIAL